MEIMLRPLQRHQAFAAQAFDDVMNFENVEFQNLVFSRKKKVLLFRLKKQTSANVADTTFKLLLSLFLYIVYGNKQGVKIYTYVKKKKLLSLLQKVCPEVSYKTDVLKHFRSSRPVCLRPATLLKMRLWRRCFPVIFVKFLRIPYFTEHLRWLFLKFCKIYRKYHCWSLFLMKVFSSKFCKNFKTLKLQNMCQKHSSKGVL